MWETSPLRQKLSPQYHLLSGFVVSKFQLQYSSFWGAQMGGCWVISSRRNTSSLPPASGLDNTSYSLLEQRGGCRFGCGRKEERKQRKRGRGRKRGKEGEGKEKERWKGENREGGSKRERGKKKGEGKNKKKHTHKLAIWGSVTHLLPLGHPLYNHELRMASIPGKPENSVLVQKEMKLDLRRGRGDSG